MQRAHRRPSLEYREAVQGLVDAARAGAEVVPFVAAGASYEAGLPIVAELVKYLALHQAYLRLEVYDGGVVRLREPAPGAAAAEARNWHRLLARHGWRRPADLNQAISWGLQPAVGPNPGTDAVVQHELRALMGGRPARPRGAPRAQDAATERLELVGEHWPRLTETLTRCDPQLQDQLFALLLHGRRPAELHRYLAALTPVLRVRLFLTANFDDLLEQALRAAEVEHRVFEVPRGGRMPPRRVVDAARSIVKLHGGTHALRAGEDLVQPLDEHSRGHFKAYFERNRKARNGGSLASATRVVLVLGFSGTDERLLDMLSIAIEEGWSILWVAFRVEEADSVLRRLGHEAARAVHVVEARDPGAFCKAVYRLYKGAHPTSRVPGPVYGAVPYPLAADVPGARDRHCVGGRALPTLAQALAPGGQRVGGQRFVRLRGDPTRALRSSFHLVTLSKALSRHARVLWINLEDKSTFAEILADIQARMQRIEPTLPVELVAAAGEPGTASFGGTLPLPHVEPAADGAQATAFTHFFERLAQRVIAALARGAFVLVFEAADGFGRGPFEHHRNGGMDWRMRAFLGALEVAAEGTGGAVGLVDSCILVSEARSAQETALPTPELWSALSPEGRAGLLRLATCRRRRSEMLVEAALADVDEAEARTIRGELVLLEGLDYWMDPVVRDAVYAAPRQDAERVAAHDWVARFYREHVYRGVGDVRAVLEELYHRFASMHFDPVAACVVGHPGVAATAIWEELFPLRQHVPPVTLARWVEAAIPIAERQGDTEEGQALCGALLRLGIGAAKDGRVSLDDLPALKALKPPPRERDAALYDAHGLALRRELQRFGKVKLSRDGWTWAQRIAHLAEAAPLHPHRVDEHPLPKGRLTVFERRCVTALDALHSERERFGVRRSLLNSALARAAGHAARREEDEAAIRAFFERAHKRLDLARFGVPHVPATLEARLVAHLRLGECLLLQAHLRVQGPERGGGAAGEADHADGALLLAARDALRGARALLDSRGPLVEHLVEYFRLRAWYGLARIERMAPERARRSPRADLVRDGAAAALLLKDRVRRALEPVRCGFDLVLPADRAEWRDGTMQRANHFLLLWDDIRVAFLRRFARRNEVEADVWSGLNARVGLERLPWALRSAPAERLPLAALQTAVCEAKRAR